ncbi:hypothetical protein DFN06_004174 [Clostridium beijerinckii]|jgi:hypothetical protein|uniref:Uncharacterized protein n=1 Tax=Clostridium beijerinckii TaxID=1520 RepID=A0AAE5LP60_CLOBE|nr:hypothetical protein [Clostridium beijerinckii]NOV68987.1 hypothetical protein [Clostridium beijerinckii]NOW32612.1 hypothetical protein [Clostridium beijerinckii]NOW82159.1 hypothetical protein [Clostridium beijerinckii]NOW89826.1 hypothetical protein [Clostridium beijerinckii]
MKFRIQFSYVGIHWDGGTPTTRSPKNNYENLIYVT